MSIRPAPLCAALLLAAALQAGQEPEDAARPERRPPNVLLLILDDLAPVLGCNGEPGAHSPHLDRLAAEGVLFTRAYAQYGICGPSRESLFSGLRPLSSRVLDLHHSYRDQHPDLVALPQLFREHGYVTAAMGKVHHGRGQLDDPKAWSVEPWRPEPWGAYYFSEEALAEIAEQEPIEIERDGEQVELVPRVRIWERSATSDDVHPDAKIALRAIDFLREEREEPFFLALGFLKPHLPFVAPDSAFERVDAEALRFPEPREAPLGAPEIALPASKEFRGFLDMPQEGPPSPERERELLVAYQACVSFVDAQVGRVLDELDRLGLAEDTIVVAWGDQGFHRGEHGIWCKGTMFEQSVHVPLIVRAPRRAHSGRTCDGMVELVDLYPTLTQLCDLPAPEHLEGTSFVPLLWNPDLNWKRAVFWVFESGVRPRDKVLARAVRTATHQYVEWTRRHDREVVARELYDLSVPGARLENRAGDDDAADLEAELRQLLQRGWRAGQPVTDRGPR